MQAEVNAVPTEDDKGHVHSDESGQFVPKDDTADKPKIKSKAAGTRRRDRKGFSSAGSGKAAKVGKRVNVVGHGEGVVDERGPDHAWVKLDKDGTIVKVLHGLVEELDDEKPDEKKDAKLSIGRTGMLIEKEVIRPGTFWYRDSDTGAPRKLVVTPELTSYWHEQGNAMLSAGLTVPVPFEHDFDAHPMTPADKLKNNAGWVDKYFLKGDRLFSTVDIQDADVAKKLPGTIRWTSPWINSFTDGSGKEWQNVISHLALTTRPRIVEQAPFGSVAAALSIATPIKSWDEAGDKGICLSRAGMITNDGKPLYPMAFSLFSNGVVLGTDASGHEHDAAGRFGSSSKGGFGDKSDTAKLWSNIADEHKEEKGDEGSSHYLHKLAKKHHAAAYKHHIDASMAAYKNGEHEEHQKHLTASVHHSMMVDHHGDKAKEHGNKLGFFKRLKSGLGFSTDSNGAAMATDASGHEHDKSGKFASAAANEASDKAEKSSYIASAVNKGPLHDVASRKHKAAAKAHWTASLKNRDKSSQQKHLESHIEHTKKAHYHATKGEDPTNIGLAMSTESVYAAFGAVPPKGKADIVEDDDTGDDNDFDDDSDGDGVSDATDSTPNGDASPIPDQPGDVQMEEILCDLLGALGIHCEQSGNEEMFKRSLYNAAMTKIHELTAKGQADGQDPNRTNPPGQPPNNPKPGAGGQPNPLIQQEQQPMFMSLEEIQKLDEPLRSVALSMHSSTVKANAKAAEAEKVLNSLRDGKLKEATEARAKRAHLITKFMPRAKPDIDAMLAMPAMALSMGEGGAVTDPMAATLAVLEKGLADLPRLLTTDASALSVQPQPQDADMLSDARADEIADGMARQMGCPPKKAG